MTDRILSLLGKWRWPLTLVGLFALAAGFDFRTPSSQFGELRAQNRHTAARVDSLVAARAADSKLLRGLATLRCLDGTAPALTAAADIPCRELTRDR